MIVFKCRILKFDQIRACKLFSKHTDWLIAKKSQRLDTEASGLNLLNRYVDDTVPRHRIKSTDTQCYFLTPRSTLRDVISLTKI